MATKTLEEFLQDRLRAFDPTIDLSSGSPADAQVIQPTVARYQPDPFEMPVEDFIDARMAQEHPDTNVQEGTGLRDLIIKPMQVLLDPVVRELQLIKNGQSLQSPDQLADSEVDALVANSFVSRNSGDLSRGKGRLYFNAPQAVRVSVGNIFYTADNLRFFPDRQQSISAENMAFNQSGSLFYFDVDVVAEQAGDQYNIDPSVNPLVGVTNISVAVRVTNVVAFTGGLPTETSDDLIARAETSITERSLVTPRGVNARIPAEFPAVTQLQVIGFSDPEMNRDVLTGGDLGESLLRGNNGVAIEDGAGNSTTTRFGVRGGVPGSVIPPGDEYTPGQDVSASAPLYLLTTEVRSNVDGSISAVHLDRLLVESASIFDTSDVGRIITIMGVINGVQRLRIAEVNGGYLRLVYPVSLATFVGQVETVVSWTLIRATRQSKIVSFDADGTGLVVLDDPSNGSYPLQAGVDTFGWEIRRQELTISGVPSGIVLSSERDSVKVLPNQVHIGGCSDFYIRGQATDQASLVIPDLEDENPLFSGGKNGRTLSGQPDFFWDRPQPSIPDSSVTSSPTTVDFVALGVEPGDSLVVESGPDAGAKTILRVGRSNNTLPLGDEDFGCLQVTPPFTSTQESLRYKIVKTVSVDLRHPTLLKGSGDDGRTLQSSNVFTTDSAVNFQDLGIAAGDVLTLTNGVDAESYPIMKVSGTGSRNLELASALSTSATGLGWQIARVQTGLQFPLIQIRSIDLLDSGSQPTGHQIPYGAPVDIRSSSFSNLGNGVKCVTSHAIVGIIGRTSIEASDVAYPLSPTAFLRISVNGESPIFISLSGVANKGALVDTINTTVGVDIAQPISIDGKDYLQLRSDVNWLQVTAAYPSSGSQWVGLYAGDDNRQITVRLDASPGFSWVDTETWFETPEGSRASLDTQIDSVQIQGLGVAKNVYLKRVTAERLLVLDFDENMKIVRFPVPQYDVTVQVGTRSIGTARIYFKDPTSMEVLGRYRAALQGTTKHPANLAAVRDEITDTDDILDTEVANTYFRATVNGAVLRFIPDPSMSRVVIPDSASPTPNNLASFPSSLGTNALESNPILNPQIITSRSEQIDFLARRVRTGDFIDVTFKPIIATGAFDLVNLVGTTLSIRLGGASPKTCIFTDQLTTSASLLAQINDFFGSEIASLDDSGYLLLEADFALEVLMSSTAIPFLGWPTPTANVTNIATNAGSFMIKTAGLPGALDNTWFVTLVDADSAKITELWDGQHFRVRRPGSQRVHTTAMKEQVENGLYYMDVQLLSEGAGDVYNIPDGTVLVATGYDADGYLFEVADPNLSFSTEEEVSLVFSRQVLLDGETDNLGNAITIAGQNVQINYDYSSLTEAVQLFASSDLDRVVTASLLVRHLLPNYLYFELTYQGGSSVDVVQADVDTYLAGLGPNDNVQASSLQELATRRGATFVQNPLALVSLGSDASRVMSVVRSSNLVSHGRLSTFFPGKVVVTQG